MLPLHQNPTPESQPRPEGQPEDAGRPHLPEVDKALAYAVQCATFGTPTLRAALLKNLNLVDDTTPGKEIPWTEHDIIEELENLRFRADRAKKIEAGVVRVLGLDFEVEPEKVVEIVKGLREGIAPPVEPPAPVPPVSAAAGLDAAKELLAEILEEKAEECTLFYLLQRVAQVLDEENDLQKSYDSLWKSRNAIVGAVSPTITDPEERVKLYSFGNLDQRIAADYEELRAFRAAAKAKEEPKAE